MKYIRALIFLILWLFIFGCTALRTSAERYDLNEIETERLNIIVRENYGRIKSIAGRFDFSYSTEKERNQSSGYIYLNRSDTLFIEINGLVGTTEAVVFIDSDSLKALNHSQKIKIFDKSDENSLKRITGINHNVSDIKNSFFIFPIDGEIISLERKDHDNLTVRVKIGEERYSFTTLDDRLFVTSTDEYFERELTARKEYDYYTCENGVFYPRRIRVRTFNPPTKLTIFFKGISVNDAKKIRISI